MLHEKKMSITSDCTRIIMEYTDEKSNRLVSKSWDHILNYRDKFIVEKCMKRGPIGNYFFEMSNEITAEEINKFDVGDKILKRIKLWEMPTLDQVNVNIVESWLKIHKIKLEYDLTSDKYVVRHNKKYVNVIKRVIPDYGIVHTRMASTTPYTIVLIMTTLGILSLLLTVGTITLFVTCSVPVVKEKELLSIGTLFGWLFYHTVICLFGLTFMVIKNIYKKSSIIV